MMQLIDIVEVVASRMTILVTNILTEGDDLPEYRSAAAARLAVGNIWCTDFRLFESQPRPPRRLGAHFPSSCVAALMPLYRLQQALPS